MKKLYVYLLFAIVVSQSYSQNRPIARWPKSPQGNYRCFTDEMDTWRLGQNNSINARSSFEKWMKNQVKRLKDQPTAGRNTPMIYNIPVIFHIIHNGEGAGTGTNIK